MYKNQEVISNIANLRISGLTMTMNVQWTETILFQHVILNECGQAQSTHTLLNKGKWTLENTVCST